MPTGMEEFAAMMSGKSLPVVKAEPEVVPVDNASLGASFANGVPAVAQPQSKLSVWDKLNTPAGQLMLSKFLGKTAQAVGPNTVGGRLGGAFAGTAEEQLLALQPNANQPKQKFTAPGIKGITSETVTTNHDGTIKRSTVEDTKDTLAGGSPIPPQPGAAFGGGGGGGLPFDQPSQDFSGIGGLPIEVQLALRKEQDPVISQVTGEDGQQYGMTRGGNMIPLGVGTLPKVAKPPKTQVISTDEGQQLVNSQTGAPIGDAFGPAPTTAKSTDARFYTDEAGARRTYEVDSKGKEVPGTDRAYDWKPNEGGKGGSGSKAWTFVEIEKRRQDLQNFKASDGKTIQGPQLQSHVRSANADLKKIEAPYRYERIVIPKQKNTFVDDPSINMVLTTEVDKQGNPLPVTFEQIQAKLIEDRELKPKEARERTAILFATKNALLPADITKLRKEFDSVDYIYTQREKKKKGKK